MKLRVFAFQASYAVDMRNRFVDHFDALAIVFLESGFDQEPPWVLLAVSSLHDEFFWRSRGLLFPPAWKASQRN